MPQERLPTLLGDPTNAVRQRHANDGEPWKLPLPKLSSVLQQLDFSSALELLPAPKPDRELGEDDEVATPSSNTTLSFSTEELPAAGVASGSDQLPPPQQQVHSKRRQERKRQPQQPQQQRQVPTPTQQASPNQQQREQREQPAQRAQMEQRPEQRRQRQPQTSRQSDTVAEDGPARQPSASVSKPPGLTLAPGMAPQAMLAQGAMDQVSQYMPFGVVPWAAPLQGLGAFQPVPPMALSPQHQHVFPGFQSPPSLVAGLPAWPLLPGLVDYACSERGKDTLDEFLTNGTEAQRSSIVSSLKGSVLRLAFDEHGCRILQRAIQVVSRQVQTQLCSELQSGIAACIEHKYGNFVAQACVEQLHAADVDFIVRAIEQRAQEVSCHNFGCRVVQRVLERCLWTQTSAIVEQIVDATVDLAKNQYGCHVLRCVLDHGRVADKRKICALMRSNLPKLARNRFANLVLDKCCDPERADWEAERVAFVHVVLGYSEMAAEQGDSSEEAPLIQLSCTKFGRNLLRRMINFAPQREKKELLRQLSKVRPNWGL